MIRKLCNADQLPDEGQMRVFVDNHLGTPLALCVGVLGGVPYAIHDACPHARASLAAGRLDGDQVVCPVHGWRWRLTDGQPVQVGDPAVPAFEVRQYGTEIFVRVP